MKADRGREETMRVTVEDLRAAAEWIRCNDGDGIAHVAEWLDAQATKREQGRFFREAKKAGFSRATAIRGRVKS